MPIPQDSMQDFYAIMIIVIIIARLELYLVTNMASTIQHVCIRRYYG